MKTCDLLRIAIKDISFKWAAPIVLLTAVGTFFLNSAVDVFIKVSNEKARPYETEVVGVASEDIAAIAKIEDVLAVSKTIKIPSTISVRDYWADIALTGIDASFINYEFIDGGVFPDDSAMPYVILSEAACKQLAGENETEIDWLNSAFALAVNGGKTVTAKVCGIFSLDGGAALGYISLSSAKDLLGNPEKETAIVRIRSAGYAQTVERVLAAMVLQIISSNESVQEKWDREMRDISYSFALAAISLFSAVILTFAYRHNYLLGNKTQLNMLQWLGCVNICNGVLSVQLISIFLLGVIEGAIANIIYKI